MTDATPASDTVRVEIDRLAALPIAQLREEWQRWHPERLMPDRLPRDLLIRTIAWKLQEQKLGRRPDSLIKRLDALARQLERTGTLDIEREAHLRPGTTLMREWRGETHRVTALDEGFAYDGATYASLSHVARAITGTRWSGPRFFGLEPAGRRMAQLGEGAKL